MTSASRRACARRSSAILSAESERVAKRLLELLVAGELALELLHLVAQVGALAPDVFEARRHVAEQLVGRLAVVAQGRRASATWRISTGVRDIRLRLFAVDPVFLP